MSTRSSGRKKKSPVRSLVPLTSPEQRSDEPDSNDLYAILGVPRTATMREILRGFRTKCQQYHPDRNPGDPTAAGRFQQVDDAYSVLSDPEQRERYDRTGEWKKSQPDNYAAMVMAIIGPIVESVFNSAIAAGHDASKIDLIGSVRKHVTTSIQTTKENAAKAKRLTAQAESAVKRVKGERPETPFVRATLERIRDARRLDSERFAEELRAYQAAEKYLKDVGYDFEKIVNRGTSSGMNFADFIVMNLSTATA